MGRLRRDWPRYPNSRWLDGHRLTKRSRLRWSRPPIPTVRIFRRIWFKRKSGSVMTKLRSRPLFSNHSSTWMPICTSHRQLTLLLSRVKFNQWRKIRPTTKEYYENSINSASMSRNLTNRLIKKDRLRPWHHVRSYRTGMTNCKWWTRQNALKMVRCQRDIVMKMKFCSPTRSTHIHYRHQISCWCVGQRRTPPVTGTRRLITSSPRW